MPPVVQLGVLPDLSNETEIGIDVETRDPELKKLGPGPRRLNGYIAGISVATPSAAFYIPIRHEGGENVSIEAVREWLGRQVFRPGLRKVGHNITYDLDFLQYEVDPRVVHCGGPFEDTYTNELLLNDRRGIKRDLDTVSERRLGERKAEAELKISASNYGIKEKDIKASLWKMSGEDVAQYGGIDSWLSLMCAHHQRLEIAAQSLDRSQDLEMRLIPLLMAMRHTGVRIDGTKLEQSVQYIDDGFTRVQQQLSALAGEVVPPWEAAKIGEIATRLGLTFGRTFKTNAPSFTQAFLEASEERFFKLLLSARRYSKIAETFLGGQVTNYLVKGRIHPIFKPDGTVTGRFSCEHPNAQFFPSRDEELASVVRGVFSPEEGCSWLRLDYSQVEYRLLVHFAMGAGAEEARELYRNDKTTDYHQMAQDLLRRYGKDLPRKIVKNINFGLIYGQGVTKTAAVLGVSIEEAKEIQRVYHAAVPFARETMNAAIKRVNERGYVQTIYGRRRRFDTWEPKAWKDKYDENNLRRADLSREESVAIYGPQIERANAYRALNSVLQGSAGEITKKAMVDMWESGVCDVLGVPHLTVHDELDCSVNFNSEIHREAARHLRHIMETSTPLKIPLYVSCESGPNWGELSETDLA